MVRQVGFEPTCPCGQQGLSLPRIPIPPSAHIILVVANLLFSVQIRISRPSRARMEFHIALPSQPPNLTDVQVPPTWYYRLRLLLAMSAINSDGTAGGIRTHTAMLLRHLPPAIGLLQHIGVVDGIQTRDLQSHNLAFSSTELLPTGTQDGT